MRSFPDFDSFFRAATGHDPYPYQIRFAEGELPQLLDIPTGLGKTACAVLGWLWRRRFAEESIRASTARRLVYCLPVRVLVDQTYAETIKWLDRLGMLAGTATWDNETGKRGLREYEVRPEINELADASWAKSQGVEGAPIAVHLLMGGEERTDWASWPERDAILIGTQDMLLSRALNRGYAAGRARWPMEFGLLNNDCLWVFDEVQLMSTGLATSLQLDAWRRSLPLRSTREAFPSRTNDPVMQRCQSVWMSATMAKHWLESAVDWRLLPANESSQVESTWSKRLKLEADDFADPRVKDLFSIRKELPHDGPIVPLRRPRTSGDAAEQQARQQQYVMVLAGEIRERRSPDGLTLVIVNTVQRAKGLYDEIAPSSDHVHLIHSQFRPIERDRWKHFLSREDPTTRLIISTQVVEAGVDISARVLFTELAPWASLVQRFGRCARYQGDEGSIYWMDLDVGTERQPDAASARPYDCKELLEAREQLERLKAKWGHAGLATLRSIKDRLDQSPDEAKRLFPYDPRFVPRDKDLFDLYDTTPDLTGADIDIARFIRDGQELDVQVFWREISRDPGKRLRPSREELCPVPFHKLRGALAGLSRGGRVWRWNYRDGWQTLTGDQKELVYPGQVFLLQKSCGGYDVDRGWTGSPDDTDFSVPPGTGQEQTIRNKAYEQDAEESSDALSESAKDVADASGWLPVVEHTGHVCIALDGLLGAGLIPPPLNRETYILRLAARWHDRGKAHPAFQAKIKPERLQSTIALSALNGEPAAKAPDDAWRTNPLRPARAKVDAGEQGPFVSSLEAREELAAAPRGNGKNDLDLRRPGFRHELASALAVLETLWRAAPGHPAFAWPEGLEKGGFGSPPQFERSSWADSAGVKELSALAAEEIDLLIYLVAAHHGKVRASLRASPDDGNLDVPDPCPSGKRQSRGVRDGDCLPECRLPSRQGGAEQFLAAPAVALNLDAMELGLSLRYGRSWRDRAQGLLERYGPFRLAFLEAILRAADWRASRD